MKKILSLFIFLYPLSMWGQLRQEEPLEEVYKIKEIATEAFNNFTQPGYPKEFLAALGFAEPTQLNRFNFSDIYQVHYIDKSKVRRINSLNQLYKFQSGYSAHFINNSMEVIRCFLTKETNEGTRPNYQANYWTRNETIYTVSPQTINRPTCYDGLKWANINTADSKYRAWLNTAGNPGFYIKTLIIKQLDGSEVFFFEIKNNVWVEQNDLIKSFNNFPAHELRRLSAFDLVEIINRN